jgi:hypothetical protein
MRGNRAAGRKISSGRCKDGPPAAREQRPEEQHRAAQAAHQRGVWFILDDIRAADPQRRAPDALNLGAKLQEQPRHHLDVPDAWNVGEHALFGRQQARGQQRQRRILVAFDLHAAREPSPAFNQQCRHQTPRDRRSLP